MSHTKGKWTIETPCGFPYSGLYIVPVIRKDFPYHIAKIRQLRESKESEANARRICQCVNNFDDLLAACEIVIHRAYSSGQDSMEQEVIRFNKKEWAFIKQAIAKAKEQ